MHSCSPRMSVWGKGSAEQLPPRLGWTREIRKWRYGSGCHQTDCSQEKVKELKMDLNEVTLNMPLYDPAVSLQLCHLSSWSQMLISLLCEEEHFTDIFVFTIIFELLKSLVWIKGQRFEKRWCFPLRVVRGTGEDYMKSQCHMDLLRLKE